MLAGSSRDRPSRGPAQSDHDPWFRGRFPAPTPPRCSAGNFFRSPAMSSWSPSCAALSRCAASPSAWDGPGDAQDDDRSPSPLWAPASPIRHLLPRIGSDRRMMALAGAAGSTSGKDRVRDRDRDRGKRRSRLARSVLYRLRMPGPVGRVDEIVVDCRDRVKLATFWAALLRVTPHVRDSTRATVPDPEQGLVVAFQEVPEPKSGKNRLHIDVQVAALEEAIAACLNLGATVEGAIIDDADGSFQVMLDPEGHEFCLVTSSLAREPSQGQRV